MTDVRDSDEITLGLLYVDDSSEVQNDGPAVRGTTLGQWAMEAAESLIGDAEATASLNLKKFKVFLSESTGNGYKVDRRWLVRQGFYFNADNRTWAKDGSTVDLEDFNCFTHGRVFFEEVTFPHTEWETFWQSFVDFLNGLNKVMAGRAFGRFAISTMQVGEQWLEYTPKDSVVELYEMLSRHLEIGPSSGSNELSNTSLTQLFELIRDPKDVEREDARELLFELMCCFPKLKAPTLEALRESISDFSNSDFFFCDAGFYSLSWLLKEEHSLGWLD
jgi:hypothetical protein